MKTLTGRASFKATEKELDLIKAIAERVLNDVPEWPDKKLTIIMDLTATNANGCELRLAELLKAEPFDFIHDIGGIRKHINRETGRLEGFFVPRYAKNQGA